MPSLLETFYVMFTSNADQVKKGAGEAKKSTDELENSLSNADRRGAQMGEHLVGVFTEVAGAVAGAFAARHIWEGVAATAEYTDQLGKTAQRLGLNIQDLDAWGQAVDRSGGSAEAFAGSLDFMNRGIADIAVKGKSRLKPFFDELKLNVLDAQHKVRPLLDIYRDLAGRFEHMTKQESAGYGEKFGMDTGTLLLLQSGRRALDELVERQRTLGTVTEEDAKTAERFNDQWDDTKQILRGVYIAIGNGLLPVLYDGLKLVERFTAYLAKHKPVVEGFFIGIAGVVTTMYLPAMLSAAAATLAAVWPFVAVAGAILGVGAAFALIYDDVVNFLDGNKSVIGEILNRWPVVGEVFRFISATIGAAFRYMDKHLHGFGAGLATAFPFWTKLVRAFGDAVLWVFKEIGAAFKWAFDSFGKLPAALNHWGKETRGALAAGTLALNAYGADPAIAAGQNQIHAAQTTRLAAIGAQGGPRSTSVSIGTLTIHTQATDADGIAGVVVGSLDNQLRQAANHFDDGVDG